MAYSSTLMTKTVCSSTVTSQKTVLFNYLIADFKKIHYLSVKWHYYTKLRKSNTNASNCHKMLKLTHILYNNRDLTAPQYLYTKHRGQSTDTNLHQIIKVLTILWPNILQMECFSN
jgi:hypothetical protein